MAPGLCATLTVLLQLILCCTGVPSPKVELRPKKPLFRVGDRQEITCRTSQCQSEKISFGWQSVQDKPLDAATSSSSTESTLIFNNVSKIHEDEILCKVSCNDKKFMKFEGVVQIRVYSFPKHPIISGREGLVLGKETTLSCNVYDVYPAERMTVEWLRGGEVVDTKEGTYGTESIQSHYTFIPQITDNNSSITCRATLAINDLPEEEKTRETTVSMSVFSFPKDPIISGHEGLVLGKETTLRCNVSDVYPAERLTVEWLRGDVAVHTQKGTYSTESIQSDYTFIPQITDHNTSIICRATLDLNGLPEEERTRETTVLMSVSSASALVQRSRSTDIVIPIVSLGSVAIIISSVYCAWKAAKKYFHALNENTPKSAQEKNPL